MPDEWSVNAEIPMPARRDYPIAIVGAGSIVNDAHMPAYRKAGFNVIGIYDIEADKAASTAARYSIPRVYRSLDELLSGPESIVDIAVPARENYALATRVAHSGKAMLLQKPLAEDLSTAEAIVNVVEETGVIAAVNQQARWMPAALVMRDLIERNLLGEIYQVSFFINVVTPWEQWPWILAGETVEVMYHSIHYLDTIRALLRQEPQLVFADGSRLPGFPTHGETRTTIQLIFADQLRATIVDTHHNIGGLNDQYATFRIDGTEGSAVAELGLLKNYPTGVPDSFRYMSRRLQPETWITPRLVGSWFPDAFIGTMASVMRGLEGAAGAPETAVRDNLNTLRLVMAAYCSMKEQRIIDPSLLS